MPKRKGHIYERMMSWEAVKNAEMVSLKNKKHNFGYRKHESRWLRDLVEVHDMVLEHRMKTGDYRCENVKSHNWKIRRISKLNFHPSHVEHQLLVIAGNDEVEKSLISHTYACRKDYGQHKAAKQLNRWVQNRCGEYLWYAKYDVVKYYENIPHALIRKELERTFKDKEYINCLMETVEKFSNTGKGIPLGIRPAQMYGNLVLRSIDRYVKDSLHVKCYLRFLDDSVALYHTKAEAKRKTRLIIDKYKELGFELHQPRIDRVDNGIDMLGYVCYPGYGMFLRKIIKTGWLKRRSHVTNTKRLREIDAAMWGYVKHGNKHCRKLYRKMNGISFGKLGIKASQSTDKNGVRIIDAQSLSMQMVKDKVVTILDVVENVSTKHGDGRIAMLIDVMGTRGKLILNAPCKQTITEAWKRGVTKMQTVFTEHALHHYDMDMDNTFAIEVNGREVNDKGCFVDTGEMVKI